MNMRLRGHLVGLAAAQEGKSPRSSGDPQAERRQGHRESMQAEQHPCLHRQKVQSTHQTSTAA